MKVNGLDHVNIVAADMEATVRFYETVLGFHAAPTPDAPAGFSGRWLTDAAGNASIHLQAFNPDRHGSGRAPDADTGWVDHVALACEGFASTLARLAELDVPHRVNDRKYGNLRQIFITDPNNVKLELNFAGD